MPFAWDVAMLRKFVAAQASRPPGAAADQVRIRHLGAWSIAEKDREALCLSYNYLYSPLLANTAEDSGVSRTGFIQPFDRVCIELKACGANDFVELRKRGRARDWGGDARSCDQPGECDLRRRRPDFCRDRIKCRKNS